VGLEFALSGRLNTAGLFWGMTATMVGVHALIGVVEGIITALVFAYVARSELAVGLADKEVTT